MNLQISKEKVLEAASKCATAKQTLQILFPEAFKQDYPMQVGDVYKDPKDGWSNLCLIRVFYAKDAYQFLGDAIDFIYSNSYYEKLFTKEQARSHLDERGMVFSHNIYRELKAAILREK